MKCYRCGKTTAADGVSTVPIDPKGPNRRWVCLPCLTDDERAAVPQDVIELSSIFDPDFAKLGKEAHNEP